MNVEILSFEGCPNTAAALELVERVARDEGFDLDVRLVDVPDPETAQRLRFLGSPTIRVDGRDVDPDAESRTEYALACRLYPGGKGVPDESLIRAALA